MSSSKKRSRSTTPANDSKRQRTAPDHHDEASSSSSATTAREEISPDLAHQLFHGTHQRIWFRRIFDCLLPNQADRIELRSHCTFFRDLLPPPTQIWTCFPHPKHAIWERLVEAVNVSWRKDEKKAPTLIVVRRVDNENEMEEDDEDEREVGEYVPFYEIVDEGETRSFDRSFQPRNYDCSTNEFVREIAGEGENDEIVLKSLRQVAEMLTDGHRFSTAENLYRRVLRVEERVLGAEHKDTLASVYNLGWVLEKQGKWAKVAFSSPP